jgi:hypothetical protein
MRSRYPDLPGALSHSVKLRTLPQDILSIFLQAEIFGVIRFLKRMCTMGLQGAILSNTYEYDLRAKFWILLSHCCNVTSTRPSIDDVSIRVHVAFAV